MPHPTLRVQTTTLWEYPSQHYGPGETQGDPGYVGATPSWVIWNCLVRWTRPGDLVVDPMAGSGTTLDVARDLGRRALGYDLEPPPARRDVFRADARKLPIEDAKADFVFVDPPYSDHVTYSGRPECIGELPASDPRYFEEMEKAVAEIDRVLRPGRYMALYVSDSFRKGAPFMPIGPTLLGLLSARFVPVDVVCVVRHNAKLKRHHWHTAAVEGNYLLRGFNYLFAMYKPVGAAPRAGRPEIPPDRRDPDEVREALKTGTVASKARPPRTPHPPRRR
jgi:SAM-dependent methyltransferase